MTLTELQRKIEDANSLSRYILAQKVKRTKKDQD